MNLREVYQREEIWHKKAIALETFHLFRSMQKKSWTVRDTAHELQCSVGYVSESLRLSAALHYNEWLTAMSRNKALRMINGH